jgi:serine/threonine protein kinase
MPLHPNSQLLVDELETLPLLAGRFSNMKLVNYDSVADEKQGCFSLVFSADDALTGEQVALKFFDLDPRFFTDKYRRAAFDREQDLLALLVGKRRCLQLVANMDVYNLNVPTGLGYVVTLPCSFFAVQWISENIDGFFFDNNTAVVEKLKIFNEIVLAVEALHRNEIFHRDLKADNLRALQIAIRKIVIAIDLGTAARFGSGYLSNAYGGPVGALGYASPEARCALAGNRILAPYSDVYALGCLLFELFNPSLFYYCRQTDNPTFDVILAAMHSHLTGASTELEQLRAWRKALSLHASGISPSKIDGINSTVPPGIAPILNEVLESLTHIDYAKRRINLEFVRRKILSSIKILENQKAYDKNIERQKQERQRREDKLRLKELAFHANMLRQAC